MNTIEIDEKGIFAYETPEQCADKKDCLANSLDWQKSFCGCLNELESAKRDRVYFKDKEPVYKLMPGLDLFPEQFLGKSYPVPEWYEVKICVEPNLRTQSSKKYAILVSKRNDPVINEYHSIAKTKDQIDREIIEMVFPETIEEAAEKLFPFIDNPYIEEDITETNRHIGVSSKREIIDRFLNSYEQFKKEKL